MRDGPQDKRLACQGHRTGSHAIACVDTWRPLEGASLCFTCVREGCRAAGGGRRREKKRAPTASGGSCVLGQLPPAAAELCVPAQPAHLPLIPAAAQYPVRDLPLKREVRHSLRPGATVADPTPEAAFPLRPEPRQSVAAALTVHIVLTHPLALKSAGENTDARTAYALPRASSSSSSREFESRSIWFQSWAHFTHHLWPGCSSSWRTAGGRFWSLKTPGAQRPALLVPSPALVGTSPVTKPDFTHFREKQRELLLVSSGAAEDAPCRLRDRWCVEWPDCLHGAFRLWLGKSCLLLLWAHFLKPAGTRKVGGETGVVVGSGVSQGNEFCFSFFD
ncbi:uncharacterized protein LOC141582177 [Saimiri boliviensis]|uniref:uncharacterized protein LOC141582177 n=1 Tax=Saimiri boliviensis TaxID=27679 RepID=UPI003D785F16